MKAVWDACLEAKIPVPKDVRDFFQGDLPDPLGVVVNNLGDAVKEYTAEMCSGFEVFIEKLPKQVKVIRFVNSW